MSAFLDPSFTPEKVVLERLKVAVSASVPRYVLDNMKIEQWVDSFSHDVSYRFSSEVLARTLNTERAVESVTREVSYEVPASTWQMFKHRHEGGRWFGWLGRRWPVRMETKTQSVEVRVNFEAKQRVAFPDATVRYPDYLGNPMYFQTVEVIR